MDFDNVPHRSLNSERKLSYVRAVSMSRSGQWSCVELYSMCSSCLVEVIDLAEPRATDYYHTVIIDCGPIVFVDSMGLATLEKVSAWRTQLLIVSPTFSNCSL